MIVVPVSRKEKRKMEEITSNHSKIAGDQELYSPNKLVLARRRARIITKNMIKYGIAKENHSIFSRQHLWCIATRLSFIVPFLVLTLIYGIATQVKADINPRRTYQHDCKHPPRFFFETKIVRFQKQTLTICMLMIITKL